MKTTIDLPDDLLLFAKELADRKDITLKEIVEEALRRDIERQRQHHLPKKRKSSFTIDEHGLPVLNKEGNSVVTSEKIYQMMEELGV